MSFDPLNQTIIQSVENCLIDIRDWMQGMRLVMNDSKTEIICFGSNCQTAKIQCNAISIGDCALNFSAVSNVKYLGVVLDQNFCMIPQIISQCKKASFNLYIIRQLRKYLTISSCRTFVQSLVISHLDYSNSLFSGLPDYAISKLQRIQNMAARVIFQVGKYEHITQYLIQLHWLPVKFRIDFKILCMVFKCIHNCAPTYLSELIVFNDNRRTRSGPSLIVPRTKTKWGDRSFGVYGPKLWNSLPVYLKNFVDYLAFRKALKTYLFRVAFPEAR
jgi:hypothetical protein